MLPNPIRCAGVAADPPTASCRGGVFQLLPRAQSLSATDGSGLQTCDDRDRGSRPPYRPQGSSDCNGPEIPAKPFEPCGFRAAGKQNSLRTTSLRSGPTSRRELEHRDDFFGCARILGRRNGPRVASGARERNGPRVGGPSAAEFSLFSVFLFHFPISFYFKFQFQSSNKFNSVFNKQNNPSMR